MTSPQKQEEQRDARVEIQPSRQPLAPQVGDAPKPEDATTDAMTSDDDSAALEASLAARQDAFRGSNAEAGDLVTGNLSSETIAPDRGEPRAAGTTPDELLHTALEHSRTPAHFGESEDVVRGSNAAPGTPAAGHPSTERVAPDRDEPREAITQPDELTTKYFGGTEAQPRRAARLDLEAGPYADFHPGMPLAGDLSIKMTEADRGEHALEELDDALIARMSGADTGDRTRVSFSPDSYESIKSVTTNLLRRKPSDPMQLSKGNITAEDDCTPEELTTIAEMVAIQGAFMKWHERAEYEKRLKSHPVLPSKLRMKTPISSAKTSRLGGKVEQKAARIESPIPTFDAAVAAAGLTGIFSQNVEDQPPVTSPIEQTPTKEMLHEMLTSKFEKATSLEPPAFASEKRAVASVDPTKIFSLRLEDLSPGFSSHQDSVEIEEILSGKTDHTLTRWRRRAVYTEENFDQWLEWAPVEKTHRDAFQCMTNLTKEKLLIAPFLRRSDPEVIAEAWNTYRKYLIEEIQQALLLGCAWKRILTKLHLAFSNTEEGYPRLKLAVELALKDSELMQFPLLHADVFIYKLDESFALGSQYEDNAYTAKWIQTTYRLPGEDAISLATRVQNAYLEWWDMDEESLYQLPPNHHSQAVCERYKLCLEDDRGEPDPMRGKLSAISFQDHWKKSMYQARIDKSGARPPTLESVVRFSVAIFEGRHKPGVESPESLLAGMANAGRDNEPPLSDGGKEPGRYRPPNGNHAERRKVARAHLQPGYQAEPPPQTYGH